MSKVIKVNNTSSERNSASISGINEFVVKFANINGTGSASANNMFAKAVFRMGLPISPKNIFPSNIQGLPTWYEVRVSEKGYLARRDGIDIMVAMNPQSLAGDVASVLPGGYLLYDSTKTIDLRLVRNDITYIGLPLTDICRREYKDARQRQLFKNIIYVGALAALLDIDFTVLTGLVSDQFKGKEKLIAPNIHALELGYQYANKNFSCPLSIRIEKRDLVGDKILIDGNSASGLGAVYGGATVVGWYPITPSTSVIEAFEKYAKRLRIDPGTGAINYATVQAEDEIAAIGIVIGGAWNGARSFTATSGPGVSLMGEFLGLAYFAEIPVVLVDVQRAGPSTGMPTRTQQSDITAAAYSSHGDTKHVLLFPSTPKECFDMTADAFDLAERLQTPVMVMSDLDLGMNDHMSEPFEWDDDRAYDRGKVLSAEQLDELSANGKKFGRYLDVDNDGICYRTFPGAHPDKGSFFTRGSSRDPYAVYTEDGAEYVANMERLIRKFETAKEYVPKPEQKLAGKRASKRGVIYYGTSAAATEEAIDLLKEKGINLDGLRVRAFPFNKDVEDFIEKHDTVFVVEQNRDAQLRSMLINELEVSPKQLPKVLNYDGSPITAACICENILEQLTEKEAC